MNWMFIVGIAIGTIVTRIFTDLFNPIIGTIFIDSSDPEKDKYNLSISKIDLSDLPKKRQVRLCVKPNADLSGISQK